MTQPNSDVTGVGGHTGTLFVVGTPIGNLEDITLRASRVLNEVDLVAAEDTRRTGLLLAHLGLHKPVISYYQHNEQSRTEELITRINGGTNVALVTDAGMPGISDPGYVLITAALAANVKVVPIPGPTAAITALVVSGLPTDRFAFEGFLPRSGKQRLGRLQALKHEERTLVFYEAPHRLIRTLTDLAETLGDRAAAVARELTKLHEETCRGTLLEIKKHYESHPAKGELVIVVGSPQPSAPCDSDITTADAPNLDVEGLLLKAISEGVSRRDAVKKVIEQTGLPRREVYQISLQLESEDNDTDTE